MESLSMSIVTDQVLFSFIRKLGLILLGVGLVYLSKAFWITWKMERAAEIVEASD